MISNSNISKEASNEAVILNIKKYIGVASVNVVAINPNNDKLRKYGWEIAADAKEPEYVIKVTDAKGKESTSTRVRFLVQIQDFDDKPVIPLDFWIRPEVQINQEGTKCKIIDQFGRTAWATKDEVKAGVVPTYSTGQKAFISTPYTMCHIGEEELVTFLIKYLNVTPLQVFDKALGHYVDSKNPGKLTIDNWKALCNGDVKEIASYLATQPDNRVKVVLGIRTKDDNKTYQTFIDTKYIGNGARPDYTTGEYSSARTIIDKYKERHTAITVDFDATAVHEWKESATNVTESESASKMFDDAGNFLASDDDDLPFD